jgi:hypothetical protein
MAIQAMHKYDIDAGAGGRVHAGYFEAFDIVRINCCGLFRLFSQSSALDAEAKVISGKVINKVD